MPQAAVILGRCAFARMDATSDEVSLKFGLNTDALARVSPERLQEIRGDYRQHGSHAQMFGAMQRVPQRRSSN